IVLRVADTYDYLYKPCPDQPLQTASEEDKAAWKAEYKKYNDAVKIYDLVDTLHSYKQALGKSVSAHVLEMEGYMDQLHTLGKSYDNDMVINLINRSLNKDFGDFVRNFNMHCVGKTVTKLYAPLIDYEKRLKDKAHRPQVLTIQKARHWKRNCPLYLEELRKNKDKAEHGVAALDAVFTFVIRYRDLKRKGNCLMVNNICKWAMEHKQQLKPSECLI
nr:hypothetical protein [Tanacetum cinerariifolium]